MVPARRPLLLSTALVCGALLFAPTVDADVVAWDQAQVTALAKQLETTTKELYDTIYKQQPPNRGSMQSRTYYQLRQKVRVIRMESGALASSLAKGEGLEETEPTYESLMEAVRTARQDARRLFTTKDVQDKSAAAREILNQLSPYYDPDATPLAPATR